MISVIIPTINDPHLVRTINSIWSNRTNDIEFIIVNDGGKLLDIAHCTTLLKTIDLDKIKVIQNFKQSGRRVSINSAAAMAFGEYLFIIDAHCSMTQGWDVKLIQSCGKKNMDWCCGHFKVKTIFMSFTRRRRSDQCRMRLGSIRRRKKLPILYANTKSQSRT